MAQSYRKGSGKGTRKGTRKGSGHKNNARKSSNRRRSVGIPAKKNGKIVRKNLIAAANRGDHGVPIANCQYGSKTLLATTLPTMSQ